MDPVLERSLLGGLTGAQRAAVTEPSSLVCVDAGAGSGKTTVLTRRVAWRAAAGDLDPTRTLIVTFTRKAGAELRSRLARHGVEGVWAGTFHAAAYAQLRRHWTDQGTTAPAVAADLSRYLRRRAAQGDALDEQAIAVVVGGVSWARARALDADGYLASAERLLPGAVSAEVVADLYRDYQFDKRRRRVIDVDDLIELGAQLVESGGTTAAAIRWRFRHLFVDEFQDMNPAQWRLLEAWRDGRDDLFVVGDARQSIYSWNGSDPSLLARITTLVPGVVRLALDENHRCTPQIVRAASAVLGAVAEEDERDAPEKSPPATHTTQPDGPLPAVVGFDDEEDEADAVVRWLRRAQRPGVPWNALAVLARTNARLEPVARALGRASIPFRLGATRSTRQMAESLAQATTVLRAMVGSTALGGALVDLGAEWAEARRPDDVLDGIAVLADEHGREELRPTVGSFLGWLRANPGALELLSGAGDAVDLCTFHRAKGLEWSSVAIVGLEEGMVPIAYAQSPAAQAEERRLLYVGVTRASRQLWCSWAAHSAGDHHLRTRGPSPLLAPLTAAAAASAPCPADEAVTRIYDLRRRLAAG